MLLECQRVGEEVAVGLDPCWHVVNVENQRLALGPRLNLVPADGGGPVSYTHLTLPTSDLGSISVVAVSLKKKKPRVLNAHKITPRQK